MENENYEQYEGKVIPYYIDGIKEHDAKVVLIDPDIGLTMVDSNNPETYLCCIVMPGSPKWSNLYNKRIAFRNFKNVIKMIRKGRYDTGNLEGCHGDPGAVDCPF